MIDTKPTPADEDFARAIHFLDRAHVQRDAGAAVGGRTEHALNRLADKLNADAVRLILKSDG